MTRRMTAFALVAAGALSAGAVRADSPKKGLFADDGKDVKSGDVRDLDYWFAKFDYLQIDPALKSRQPEGRIALELGSLISHLKDLIKKYPNHEDLKKWKARAQELADKVDPDAPRNANWKKGCLWADGDYRAAWAAYHAGKMAYADKEWDEATLRLRYALEKFEFLQKRLDDLPDEAQAWIKEARPDARKMFDDAHDRKK